MHISKPIIAAFAAFATLAASAIAHDHGGTKAEISTIGPVVGEAAPSTASATIFTPDDAVAPGTAGTVLVFFRSADWCPFCKTQLKELNDIAVPLSEAGWILQGISYDSPETLEQFASETGLSFSLLSDEGSAIITEFGLLNTDVREGSRTYGIPHPAVVFIKADGTVGAVLREDGYRTRPSLEAITETASLLNAVTGD